MKFRFEIADISGEPKTVESNDQPNNPKSKIQNPKWKVLMTADTVGGVWTYALELAAALGEHGLEVALATMGAPLTTEQYGAVRHIPNLEVFESRFKLEWMEDPWQDVTEAGEWLLQLEGRLQPDIVHLNGYVHAALPWQAPTLVVRHSCVLSWWEVVKGEPAPASWDRYRQEVRRGLQAANLVIAPLAAMLHKLNQHYGSFVNGRVIPNGRDALELTPQRMVLGYLEAYEDLIT